MKGANTRNILLPGSAFVASAVMLTVIQAPISWSALAWVSLVPFILACSPESRPKHLVPAAYVVSLCYWLGNLYWVSPITLAGWFAFCLYTAVLWPILALCLRYCRMKRMPLFLASGVLFVGAERLQGLFLGGFFWRFLAHSQYHNITLIQIADIFGAAGVSFLVAMVNGLLAELIIDVGQKNSLKIGNFIKTALVCAAVVTAVVYGRWRIEQSDKFVEQGPLVASLQSNVPQSAKKEGLRGEGDLAQKTSDEIFDELMEKSKAGAEAGAELVIWPETMVQAILDEDVWPFLVSAEKSKTFDKALREHSKDTAFVLVGSYGGSIRRRSDSDISLARYNSAFLYRPDGQQDQERYDKIHLVLFGEVLPFRNSCPLLFKMLMKFNPLGYDHSIDAGSEYTVFEMTTPVRDYQTGDNGAQGQQTSNGADAKKQEEQVYRFSTIICYEATMPAIVRSFVLDRRGRKQIDWLVNISNDGWFVRFKGQKVHPSTELPQHAAVCVFRAVENRLAVVRSVNTGISCLIDSLGRIRDGYIAASADLPITAMERKGMAGWFVDEMPIDKRVTVFSKYGQWLDSCCAICLVLLIMVPFTTRLFRIRKSNSFARVVK